MFFDESNSGMTRHIALIVQCFPPLIRGAGGVAKRYYRLCKCLIEEYKYKVTLVTPVDIRNTYADVDQWISTGSLTFVPVPGFLFDAKSDGVVLGCNVFSTHTIAAIARVLMRTDAVFMDDIFPRQWLTLLCTAMNVPCIATSHTDFSKTAHIKANLFLDWMLTRLNCCFTPNILHATTTRVYAQQRGIAHVWPPMLWSEDFKRAYPHSDIAATRRRWTSANAAVEGICLYAGRISSEKRIELLVKAVPSHLMLVIVGDCGTDDAYLRRILAMASSRNLCFERGFVDSATLALYYQSCDMFLSASNFETCGNSIIEALTCGAVVAVQPEQGHLEVVRDCKNGFFINYDNSPEAMRGLTHAFARRTNLPELARTRAMLRDANFGKCMHHNLLDKALRVSVSTPERFGAGVLYAAVWLLATPIYWAIHALVCMGAVNLKHTYMHRG